MSLIGVVGSPREGNTEYITKTLLMKLERSGIKTGLVLLRDLEFSHCRACWKCFRHKTCQIKDVLTKKVFPEMLSSDAMIFASPSFYGSVSGLMKNFMDRCTPFLNSYNPGPLRGKKSANLIVYGREGGVYVAQATLDYWCLTMGIKVIHNGLFHFLQKKEASRSSYLLGELDIVAEKILRHLHDKRIDKTADDYPRIIVREEAIMRNWRTPRSN